VKGPRHEEIVLATARKRFGAIPDELAGSFSTVVRKLVESRKMPGPAELEFVAHSAMNWQDMLSRLRRIAGEPIRVRWTRVAREFLYRQFRRLSAKSREKAQV
jgi:hypothetical protein